MKTSNVGFLGYSLIYNPPLSLRSLDHKEKHVSEMVAGM